MPAFPLAIAQVRLPNMAVILRGRTLPHRGVTWAGTQRVNVQYFPGNPVATSQVIGPTYEPTTMRGRWSDAFMLTAPSARDTAALRAYGLQGGGASSAAELINFPALSPAALSGSGPTFASGGAVPGSSGLAQRARVLRDAVDLLRRSGQLLLVEWGSIARYGFLTRTSFDHDREEDIRWEMEFTWIGDTDVTPKIRKTPTLAPLGLLRRLQALLSFIMGQIAQWLAVADRYISGVKARVERLNSGVIAFLGALRKFASYTLLPAELAGAFRQQLVEIRLAARDVVAQMRQASAAYNVTRDGTPVEANFAAELAAAIAFNAQKLAAEVSITADQLEELEQSDILAVHVLQAESTLRDVSTRYYGSPSRWGEIADFNDLSGSVAPAGTVLRIPRLPGT